MHACRRAACVQPQGRTPPSRHAGAASTPVRTAPPFGQPPKRSSFLFYISRCSYYEAGNVLKHALPTSATLYLLSWAGLEFQRSFLQGAWPLALRGLWGTVECARRVPLRMQMQAVASIAAVHMHAKLDVKQAGC